MQDYSNGKIDISGTTIVLTHQLLEKMHAHAISAFPEECCGLMLGTFEENSRVKKVIELKQMKNVFAPQERYHRYTIDPMEFMQVENEAEKKGEEIIGVYHSHPNAPSRPSLFDQGHAWPSLSYVVIEIREKKPISIRSWLLREDRGDFLQEKIKSISVAESAGNVMPDVGFSIK